jgi:indole-3-glycerol phosphate synthase
MTSTSSAPDLLNAIVASVRATVEWRKQQEPLERLAERALPQPGRGQRFRDAISRRDCVNVIAECKRRSPAKGVLRRDYDAAAIAAGYERAGAAAISVLTEPSFFDGSLDDLRRVRHSVTVPLLRKDFIVDEYQMLEAVAAGADAILLIVAALPQDVLRRLLAGATSLGLASIVEVHDRAELDRALGAGATIVGVNNRNLRTLQVNLETSRALIEVMPRAVVAVAESGLRSPDEIRRLLDLGYEACLIGERLMTEPDPGAALQGLLQGARPEPGRGVPCT